MPMVERQAGALIDCYALEEIGQADYAQIRSAARQVAIDRARNRAIAADESGLALRSIRPDDDLDAGGVTYEQWLTGALTAGTEYTFVNNITLDVQRVLVIYGIFVNEPNPSPSEFRFRQNTGGTVPLAFVNVTHLRANLVNKGVLSDLIAYDPQDIMNITIIPSVTDAGGQVVGFLGYVAEPKGRSFVGPTI